MKNPGHNAFHSPGFNTALENDYKFCLRINLNGVDSAIETHISLFDDRTF